MQHKNRKITALNCEQTSSTYMSMVMKCERGSEQMSERKEVTRAKNEKPNYYYDERKKNIQRNRHRERE